jgi:hypothetical protein
LGERDSLERSAAGSELDTRLATLPRQLKSRRLG